jgi:hypothetical protein
MIASTHRARHVATNPGATLTPVGGVPTTVPRVRASWSGLHHCAFGGIWPSPSGFSDFSPSPDAQALDWRRLRTPMDFTRVNSSMPASPPSLP